MADLPLCEGAPEPRESDGQDEQEDEELSQDARDGEPRLNVERKLHPTVHGQGCTANGGSSDVFLSRCNRCFSNFLQIHVLCSL